MKSTVATPASASGFSLVEIMVAVLMVAMSALLLVQVSRSNITARAQSLARSSAVDFGAELAEWARRGGHHELGMPLAQALDATEPPASVRDCHDPAPACDPRQAAWHFLSRWRARLRETIADARLVICADQPPEAVPGDWSCDPDGPTQVLKIGRAWQGEGNRPSLTIDLGVAP